MDTTKGLNSKMKLIIGGIIILILIIIGIVSYFCIRSNISTEPSGYKVGDTATIGNYSITVDKVRNTTKLGKTTLSQNKTDNNFFVADINLSDTSKSPIPSLDLKSNQVTLKTDGQTYQVDDSITMDASETNLADYLTAFSTGSNLKPNVNYAIPIVFETKGPINSGEIDFTIDNKNLSFQIEGTQKS